MNRVAAMLLTGGALLVAATAPSAGVRARECGCDDYISKPVDEDVLYAKLKLLLKSQ